VHRASDARDRAFPFVYVWPLSSLSKSWQDARVRVVRRARAVPEGAGELLGAGTVGRACGKSLFMCCAGGSRLAMTTIFGNGKCGPH
jgi:hypothetical protein